MVERGERSVGAGGGPRGGPGAGRGRSTPGKQTSEVSPKGTQDHDPFRAVARCPPPGSQAARCEEQRTRLMAFRLLTPWHIVWRRLTRSTCAVGQGGQPPCFHDDR